MKYFLHWASSMAVAVLTSFMYCAYGWAGWWLSIVLGLFVMLAQWYEGRYCK